MSRHCDLQASIRLSPAKVISAEQNRRKPNNTNSRRPGLELNPFRPGNDSASCKYFRLKSDGIVFAAIKVVLSNNQLGLGGNQRLQQLNRMPLDLINSLLLGLVFVALADEVQGLLFGVKVAKPGTIFCVPATTATCI